MVWNFGIDDRRQRCAVQVLQQPVLHLVWRRNVDHGRPTLFFFAERLIKTTPSQLF